MQPYEFFSIFVILFDVWLIVQFLRLVKTFFIWLILFLLLSSALISISVYILDIEMGIEKFLACASPLISGGVFLFWYRDLERSIAEKYLKSKGRDHL